MAVQQSGAQGLPQPRTEIQRLAADITNLAAHFAVEIGAISGSLRRGRLPDHKTGPHLRKPAKLLAEMQRLFSVAEYTAERLAEEHSKRQNAARLTTVEISSPDGDTEDQHSEGNGTDGT